MTVSGQTTLTISGMFRNCRKTVLHLLVLVVALQASFPRGTMAGQGDWVELCTGDPSSRVLIFLDTPDAPHSGQEMSDLCLFSAFDLAALSLHWPILDAEEPTLSVIPRVAVYLPQSPRYSARAPPIV